MSEIMLQNPAPGWKMYRLGQLFSERREKVSDKDFPPLSVTMNGIVPQLDSAAKTDDGDNRKLVRAGDYVINSRSDRKGSGGISPYDGSVSLISIVLEPKRIDPAFAHHLLRSAVFQEEFYRWGHGIVADLWTTRYSDMKNIRIYIPDLATQRKIADFLDRETARIDLLIEKKQRLVALWDERIDAAVSEIVLQSGRPAGELIATGVDWLGRVPSSWQLSRIGWELQLITYGFTNPMPTEDDGPFLVTANDVNYGRILWEGARHTSQHAFDHDLTDKSRPRKGDVLLTKDGTLGRVAIHDGRPACINQSVALLRPRNSRVTSEFLANVLLSRRYQDRMRFEAGGTTIKHIYITRLQKMPFPVPSLEEQIQINTNVEAARERVRSLSEKMVTSITRLREYRSALITAAVTGQIDVAAQTSAGTTDRQLDAIQEEMGA